MLLMASPTITTTKRKETMCPLGLIAGTPLRLHKAIFQRMPSLLLASIFNETKSPSWPQFLLIIHFLGASCILIDLCPAAVVVFQKVKNKNQLMELWSLPSVTVHQNPDSPSVRVHQTLPLPLSETVPLQAQMEHTVEGESPQETRE